MADHRLPQKTFGVAAPHTLMYSRFQIPVNTYLLADLKKDHCCTCVLASRKVFLSGHRDI
jgi:hypothetical protein